MTADEPETGAGPVRLQKVLASAGLASRRVCEEMIADGRVTVDGRVAELGDRADPEQAQIHVDGERVVVDPRLVYLAFNKPRGVVSTMDDEQGRAALADYLAEVPQRVFHVGRLDTDSEGLLLLTNDGELAHRLTHPSYGVAKTYLCQVRGPVPKGLGRALRAGVQLADGPAVVDSFRLVDTAGRKALVEVVLHEGRKHIVRRMMSEVGHPVQRLVRTAVGPVSLGQLKPGTLRRLTRREVSALYAATGESAGTGPAPGGPEAPVAAATKGRGPAAPPLSRGRPAVPREGPRQQRDQRSGRDPRQQRDQRSGRDPRRSRGPRPR